MKLMYLNYSLIFLILTLTGSPLFASPLISISNPSVLRRTTDYSTSVTFPAGFVIGDYVEFLGVTPADAGAAGYFTVSISYTRGNIAAAATHVASISHSNPAVWRETGRVNNNGYITLGQNFTVDCNTEYANPRFRIRAINTIGFATPLTVNINVMSINLNTAYTPMDIRGNDQTVPSLLPMTNEWDLYVGNPFSAAGASIAIKAVVNGNVGIGTANPQEKLSVNGNIRAREIKVETTNWPDYVFKPSYILPSLADVETYIAQNHHLPEIPSEKEISEKGLSLGEMNKLLIKKVEELTLYQIERDKKARHQELRIAVLEKNVKALSRKKISKSR